ncbi:type III-A CRISPR-associated RAMP protein Csm4 [Microscilla marina]|uniref:CRISPR system Cms protein Csm4 n=1 Tax=Microscilla marina ATCC 23134 TaxID=313606 RepID=A1ZV99_MICM2|nr:hypothetical protein [Microscilla marina]EAY25755.1 crispr-associated ramp protein, Csm4 family [Microscilla marina ATCC 23134]
MMKIVYLKPKAGFRSGMRSDTLWGTLCWAIYHVYGNQGKARLEAFLASYDTNAPALVLSSAFPYKQLGDEKRCFYPKPYLSKERKKEMELQRLAANEKKFQGDKIRAKLAAMNEQKKVRKQSFLTQDQFFDLMQGTATAESIEEDFWSQEDENKEENEKNKDKQRYTPPTTRSISVTHNAIDRIKGSTMKRNDVGQLFHVTENYLEDKQNNTQAQDNVGLFFLAEVRDVPVFEAALRYLQHAGFGGDRGTGKGHFEITCEDFDRLPKVNNPNVMTNLSLYLPTQGELAAFSQKSQINTFRYQLENRQGRLGFVNSPAFLKKPLTMFKEGGIFPYINQTHFGQKVDVTSAEQAKVLHHKLWHNGLGLMVPMRLKETTEDKN